MAGMGCQSAGSGPSVNLAFIALRGGSRPNTTDGLLAIAVASAAVSYLGGAEHATQIAGRAYDLWLLSAVPPLGERLDATTVAFSLAVIATVVPGKRMPVATVRSAT